MNFTNIKITQLTTLLAEYLDSTAKTTIYKLASLIEIKAVFGIMYLRGALHLNGVDCDIAFYHESSNEILQSTMSRKRFQFLSKIMQFDDCGTRPDRWKQDKFACLRDFFESINEMFVKLRVPSEHLAIDENPLPIPWTYWFPTVQPQQTGEIRTAFP